MTDNKARIVTALMELNFFLSPGALSSIPEDIRYEAFLQDFIPKMEKQERPMSLGKEDILKLFAESTKTKEEKKPPCGVQIVNSYSKKPQKKAVQDFVSYFRARYDSLKKLLQNRMEMKDAISIRRLSGNIEREKVSIIGLVVEKNITKNGHMALKVEDTTGTIRVMIKKDKESLFNLAKDITHDEVLGIVGNFTGEIIFANTILLPEVPGKGFKKAPDEAYAAFTADMHVGSNMFLPNEFVKFVKWLNGESGTDEQKRMAMAVKYLFIVGDLVDGVGIYPGQEKELEIKDIVTQYNECKKYLAMIRGDIQIIICPGNHDAGRIAAPQPPLAKEYAGALYGLPNISFVSNPAVVNIHATEDFPGFDVLLYHGYGFDYYIANIENLRNNGGYDRADLLMKWLLQKRHLAPTHTSTLYIPDKDEDPLVINTVPDFFVTGHIHKVAVSNYKSTTMICCSCWQDKTSFQEKLGHNPEPGKVPIVNLKTREMKLMSFKD